MSEHVRPKHYRKEPLGWAPQFMALWISRVLFYPTLIYNVTLYYLWPTKFRNWWDRVDDSIILGALPFYWHVPLLYNQGVRGVVNTCDEYAGPVQTYARYGIEQLRVPIVDYFPPTLEDVKVALRFIRKHTNNGDSVYVHCKAGRARSTTIVLMAKPFVLYGHPVSQPTRAVMWACLLHDVPFEFREIDILAGAARSPEFKAINPAGTVPTIDDNGFVLYESNAILTYLAEKFQWNDVYPSGDLQMRARINQYLHWHHHNSRQASIAIFRPTLMAVFRGTPNTSDGKPIVAKVAATLDQQLTKSDYLLGEAYTLADLAAYCEFDQLAIMNLFDFTPYPALVAWMARMKALPKHDQAHQGLIAMAAVVAQKLGAASL